MIIPSADLLRWCAFQNVEFYEDKEELESIIKQAAKERLRLERQITKQNVSRMHLVFSPFQAPHTGGPQVASDIF